MNTKKLLISGAIATGMLVGVAMPSVFAANKITFQKKYLTDGESVTIMQNADEKSVPSINLTEDAVKTAIEKKFTGTKVKTLPSKDAKVDGKNVKVVGTGTVVELVDGVKIKVVYKGDVNSDGRVSITDAAIMVRSSNNGVKLTPEQTKAGDIGGVVDKVNASDAAVVVRLLNGGEYAKKAYNKMEEFMPEDVVVVDNKVVAEKAEAVKEVPAVKEVCEDITVTPTENGAKAEVKIKADQKDTKLSDVKSQLKETVLALATDNAELIEAAKSVKLHYDNGTAAGIDLEIDLSDSENVLATVEQVKTSINALLEEKTLASLMGDKLTVTVELDAAKSLLSNAKEGATQVYEIAFDSLEELAK